MGVLFCHLVLGCSAIHGHSHKELHAFALCSRSRSHCICLCLERALRPRLQSGVGVWVGSWGNVRRWVEGRGEVEGGVGGGGGGGRA